MTIIIIIKGGEEVKKLISLIFAIILVAVCAFGMAGCGSSPDIDQGTGKANGNTATNNQLGDYSVEIESCRLAKDYEGDDVVIVKYLFTNDKDDDATAFYLAIEDAVYQDGVGLNEAIFLDDSANYSSDNQMKEIKKGASIEVEVAYELNDTTTDIEVEVKELISFSDKTIKKTFSLQ